MSQAAADASRKIRAWRKDAIKFAWDQFQFVPDPWQREVLEVLPDPEKARIAMKACKGPGKTALLAVIIWWFLTCFGEKGEHPKGAATAISKDNLKDNLWTELAKWRNRSQFLLEAFEWTKERIFAKDHPETWFFSARAWAKSANSEQQADTLAGFHAKFLLFVIDESGGVPDSVMVAADAGLSTMQPGHWLKVIQAGNPTHLSGPLYRACTTERHLWYVVEISGDPDDPNRSSRISVQWARDQIDKYGRDNPWVLVNVFGKFPPASMNALLGPDDCTAAMKRHLREDQYQWAAKVLGVDVARFGDDRTVLYPRQGLASFKPIIMRNANTQEIASRVAQAWHTWQPDAIFVDDTGGWGAGVVDALHVAQIPVMGINFSSKAANPRYFNKRSEMYFEACDWVKNGGVLPDAADLTRELTTHTYFFHEGKMRIIEKDQVKEELNGHSPDLSDAFALTFAMPVAPRSPVLVTPFGLPVAGENRNAGDYDPYDESRINARGRVIFLPPRRLVLPLAA